MELPPRVIVTGKTPATVPEPLTKTRSVVIEVTTLPIAVGLVSVLLSILAAIIKKEPFTLVVRLSTKLETNLYTRDEILMVETEIGTLSTPEMVRFCLRPVLTLVSRSVPLTFLGIF